MEYKDYYNILGVNKKASEKDIRSAYRKLARQYHPDVNPGNKDAESRFKEINEAYQVLSDSDKRAKYDRFGSDWERYQQTTTGTRDTDFGRWFTGRTGGGYQYTTSTGGFDAGGFSDFFRTLFGNFAGGGRTTTTTHQRTQLQRGEDIEQEIEVSLQEAFSGTNRILQMQGEATCPECNGVGIKNSQLCNTCHGRGTVDQGRRIEVRIPAGVYDGARVRIAGKGEPGYGGAASGDLYLRVRLRAHPGFEVEGTNVYVDVPVDMYTCLLGGEAQVQVPSGKKLMLTIPPNTNNGKAFKLRGQGMPLLQNPSQHGDLIARVVTDLPTDLNEEQKELLQQLRKSGGSAQTAAGGV